MDYLALITEAVKMGYAAYKAGKVARAEGERLSGLALLEAMRARFEASRADPGLPPEVRAP